MFDAYEADLPYLKIGDKVSFQLQALPDKTFSGRISFIDPILDKASRTAKVRVETANPGLQLKPEMYADASIQTSLKQHNNEIVIPKSAVLWTGKRSIVYVKQAGSEMPVFKLREIDLGPSLGDSYVVLSGITDGEEIVTSGAFTVDASAQLEGKPSMMNKGNSHSGGEHATILVQGLCDICKERIEKTAKEIGGVSSAIWEIETKQLHLHFDSSKTSPDAVAKAIAKAGHDTEKYKADDKTYDALPDCCKYRK
jgi:Cu(I)/Ag(I) efflux system membrane fusion protein